MRYLPTLNIWNRGISHAVRTGQLKLQRGQWIQCGANAKHRSRFVRIVGDTIHAAHWEGSPSATKRRYQTLCEIAANEERGKAHWELCEAVAAGSLDGLSPRAWKLLREFSNKVEKGCAV